MSDIVGRVKEWLGLKAKQRPELQRLREALDSGRRAKFAEEYDRALQFFNRAIESAQDLEDMSAVAVVALHQVEVLIRLKRFQDAEQLLASLEHSAQLAGEPIQTAYILCAAGTLKQEQGDWAGARALYEKALETARAAHSVGAEGRALGHLGDTYLHEGNASYATHLLKEALPKLNQSGDIELSSYFVGLLGQAMIRSGQEVEGQHLLGRALQLAEQIHYRPYERHWARVLGERAYAEGRFQDAYTHYTQALRLYSGETPDNDYVSALCHMSQVCLSLRDLQQALDYAEQAVTRGELVSQQAAASAWGVMGSVLRALGRSAEAIPFLSAAADAYSRSNGTGSDPIEVETLRTLAAAMVDAEDQSAAATYQQAIEKATQLNMPLELAQTRRDLGLMYAKRGEKPLALQEWSASLAIYHDHNHHAQVARLYTDMGAVRRGLGQGQRALKDYEQALMALNSVDEHDYETRGVVLANAATVFAEKGDTESADAFFTESITLAEKAGDAVGESTRRGNYGLFLLNIGRPRRALAMLEQALQISRAHNLTLQAAVQTSNMGLAHDTMNAYPEALQLHRQALDMVRPLKEPHWRGHISVNLANTLIALGQLEEARALLESTVAGAREAGDTEVLIAALTASGRLRLRLQQLDAADHCVTEAVTLARRYDFRRLLAEALSVQSEYQAALGKAEQAGVAWDEAQKLFTQLRMPQAKTQPAWLGSGTAQS